MAVLVLTIGGAAFLFFKHRVQTGTTHSFVAHALADTLEASQAQIIHSLDSFFTNRSLVNGFSGSVLIAMKGKPVYQQCFGYCDYTNKDLLADTNAFQLASVSKTFTATAVLWCAEHQLLSLTDSVSTFFPLFPYKGVRVKDLLCHRSGLPNYIYFCSGRCKKNMFLTNDEVIGIMVQEKPAAYARPDKKFEYSNTNYLLLASIIEKVSGKKFHQFMEETFFKPLKMDHTFIYNFNDSSNRKTATSYNSKWQIQQNDCFDGVVGDKGVYSTVRDMFIWDMAFYQGKLLSQEMMKEAYTPRSFEKPGKRNYGYGWRLQQQPNGNYLVYHNGWWHGNNTVFYRNIQDTTTVIILSNKFNRSVYQVKPIFDILYQTKGEQNEIEEE